MASTKGKVLIVRHGKARGRLPDYFREALNFIARFQPHLHARTLLHETGMPAPPLDDVNAVLFWLADPLRESYPECYADATGIAESARARGIRLVNPPDALSNTIKTRQSALWRDAGVPTAETDPFATAEELRAILDRLPLPVIVRPTLTHAQIGLHVCATVDDALKAAVRLLPAPTLVAPLIDIRAAWHAADRRNLYAQLHHKKRCYVLGSHVLPFYIYFSPYPVVAGATCTFDAAIRQRMKLPKTPMRGTLDAHCFADDYLFATGPAEDADLMLRAARTLEVDFLAIDYATRADGNHVLWEANPYPNLNPLRFCMMAAERRMAPRYAALYALIGKFLLELAEGSQP